MSTTSVVTCDVCGAQKREVNHWFVLAVTEDKYLHCTSAENVYEKDPEQDKDCCGLECATKLFQRFLAHGTLEQRS